MEMSEEKIKIKGENGGLSLAFPAAMPFSEIMEELGKKLDSGAGFFLRGTLVRVPRDRFSQGELARCAGALSDAWADLPAGKAYGRARAGRITADICPAAVRQREGRAGAAADGRCR